MFKEAGAVARGFAAFVSSVIGGGIAPAEMGGVRARLNEIGLVPYDCLDPTLMDALATHAYKKADAS